MYSENVKNEIEDWIRKISKKNEPEIFSKKPKISKNKLKVEYFDVGTNCRLYFGQAKFPRKVQWLKRLWPIQLKASNDEISKYIKSKIYKKK